jgi:hypothetical protein
MGDAAERRPPPVLSATWDIQVESVLEGFRAGILLTKLPYLGVGGPGSDDGRGPVACRLAQVQSLERLGRGVHRDRVRVRLAMAPKLGLTLLCLTKASYERFPPSVSSRHDLFTLSLTADSRALFALLLFGSTGGPMGLALCLFVCGD